MSDNLAVYLNLPEYFHDAGEKLREHYYFNFELFLSVRLVKSHINLL